MGHFLELNVGYRQRRCTAWTASCNERPRNIPNPSLADLVAWQPFATVFTVFRFGAATPIATGAPDGDAKRNTKPNPTSNPPTPPAAATVFLAGPAGRIPAAT